MRYRTIEIYKFQLTHAIYYFENNFGRLPVPGTHFLLLFNDRDPVPLSKRIRIQKKNIEYGSGTPPKIASKTDL